MTTDPPSPSTPPEPAGRYSPWPAPFLLFTAALLFYLATLAPTLLWGDDAAYQRAAFDSLRRPYALDHWLWLKAAQLFVRLPWGDVAYRVNLLSAVAAATTIAFVYFTGRALAQSATAALAAALSLAVAHTFWMHAVRAEVYTLFTALLALQLCLWFNWRPRRPWPLYAAALLSGLTLLAHQMALLLAPAAACLLWQRRAWLRPRQWALLAAALPIGLLPFLLVIRPAPGGSLLTALQAHFTRGGQFSHALFDFAPHTLPRDLALWLAFLGLQFVGPALLLGLTAIIRALRPPSSFILHPAALPLLVLYATSVLFALSYRVNDQYVFYLPGYVAFALLVGRGWQALAGRPFLASRRRQALLLLTLLIAPIFTYATLPRLLNLVAANPLAIRHLPGREPNTFFLWPGKGGYYGASDYARAALQAAPPAAIIIADHTPLEPLRYLQVVEGLRPDVQLLKIEPGDDLAPLVARLPPGAPLYLADDNPAYYNLRHLPAARLQPAGPIYRLLTSR